MEQVYSSIIYENPLPQLRSRQAAFPWLCEATDGSILISHWYADNGQYKTIATNIQLERSKNYV